MCGVSVVVEFLSVHPKIQGYEGRPAHILIAIAGNRDVANLLWLALMVNNSSFIFFNALVLGLAVSRPADETLESTCISTSGILSPVHGS